MSTDPPPPLQLAVVAERRLVGQAVAGALGLRRLAPQLVSWPNRPGRARMLRRILDTCDARMGLLMCDLATPDVLIDVQEILGTSSLSWLLVTGSSPGPRWGMALDSGAAAVLPMSTSVDALATAVLTTARGLDPMPAGQRERVLRAWHEVADEQRDLLRRMRRLTPRETQVLSALYEGRSVRQIAEASGVTEATVRSQVKTLRRKIGADSQLAAVAVYRKALEIFPQSRAHARCH